MQTTKTGVWVQWMAGIVAVAILAALFVPSSGYSGPGPNTMALSNVKQCARGLVEYTTDYDDVVPYVHDSAQLIGLTHKYVKHDEIWDTRNDKTPGKFLFNMCLAGASVMDMDHPEMTLGIHDPHGRYIEGHPEIPWKYVVSFIDGHAKVQNQDKWRESAKYFSLKLKKHGKPLN